MNARVLGPCVHLAMWVHDERAAGADPEHLLVALSMATAALRARLLREGHPRAVVDRCAITGADLALRLMDVEVA